MDHGRTDGVAILKLLLQKFAAHEPGIVAIIKDAVQKLPEPPRCGSSACGVATCPGVLKCITCLKGWCDGCDVHGLTACSQCAKLACAGCRTVDTCSICKTAYCIRCCRDGTQPVTVANRVSSDPVNLWPWTRRHNNPGPYPGCRVRPPSTNASTVVRPSWRRDSLAVTLYQYLHRRSPLLVVGQPCCQERFLAPARKIGRGGAHGRGCVGCAMVLTGVSFDPVSPVPPAITACTVR